MPTVTITQWFKTSSGCYSRRGVGRINSYIVDRDRRTGRGRTVYAAYTEAGYRVGAAFTSRQAAQDALEYIAKEA